MFFKLNICVLSIVTTLEFLPEEYHTLTLLDNMCHTVKVHYVKI